MNNNEKARPSSLFVGGSAVNGQNFLPAEAELPVQEAVEAPAGDVEDVAYAGEIDVRVKPDPVPVHQAGEVGQCAVECEHRRVFV